MKRIGIGIAGTVLGAVLALSLPTIAQTDDPANAQTDRTITVSGAATIRSAPDEAVVWLGVQTEAPRAQAAMEENSRKMNAVIDALRKLGIGEKDLATSGISLWPRYDNGGVGITGYQAQNQIEVTVHDMDGVGNVIDSAVDAGANLTNGVTFRLSEGSRVTDQALAGAIEDARSKAETLASAAGAGLGPVVSISEISAPSYPPVYFEDVAAAEGASTPVVPPTLENQISVTVVWSLV